MSSQIRAASPDHRGAIDLAIETTWLAALALVPLVFSGPDVVVFFLQPKDFVLHFAALLIVALWGFEWAIEGRYPSSESWSMRRIVRWPGRDPRNWALAAAGAFGLTAIISTVLSPLPEVSLWGRDFAQVGYELYSVLSLLVIFFAIAVRVHDQSQVRRILWVIAAVGVMTALYGVSQRFGWDPIGNGEDQARVISSFGNPIFFGSFLVMSVVVTLGVALDPPSDRRRWWLSAFSLLIGVQLAAMWFTGSRGPWIGLAIGLGTFIVLGLFALDRRRIVRAAGIVTAGLLIAVLVVNLAGDPGEGRSRGVGSVVSEFTPGGAGLGGRSSIWKASVRLLDSWERQEPESSMASALRPVFGLGPEMYYYSYPRTASQQDAVAVVSHAHNFPLQVVLELGVVGLVTFVALAVFVLIAGMGFVVGRGRDPGGTDDWLAIAMVAVMAGLVGRGVEQTAGVARVGDLVPFWALLGVAIGIYGLRQKGRNPVRPGLRTRSTGRLFFLPLGAASAIAMVALSIFVARDVQMLRSGLVAADGFDESAAGNRTEAIGLFKKAARISPDVEQYHVLAGELLIEDARAQSDAEEAMRLLADAYDIFVAYEMHNGLSFTTQFRISTALAEMVSRGDDSRRDELVERSVQVADAMGAFAAGQAFAAQRILIAGEFQLGLEVADRAIGMEGNTGPQPFAWFLRGDALRKMGDNAGALAAFDSSLDRSPEGDFAPAVHRSMARIHEALGNLELAAEHRSQASDIKQTRQALPGG